MLIPAELIVRIFQGKGYYTKENTPCQLFLRSFSENFCADQPALAGIKAMEEVETEVADFEATRRILLGLGYQEALWYEKCREQWRVGEALVCLDVLPFGEFVEIEGSPGAIAAAASELGLDMARALALTYHDIYKRHPARLATAAGDSFVFSGRQKERLREICPDVPLA